MIIGSSIYLYTGRFAVKTDLWFSGNGQYSTANMSTTKQYTPTTTARPTWRDREAQRRERQQREAARIAAEEEAAHEASPKDRGELPLDDEASGSNGCP
jgi:hypothetical protein